MKVLCYISNNDFMSLDEAVEQANKGADVYFLLCDDSIRGCNVCHTCDKATCILCTYMMKKQIHALQKTGGSYHIKTVSELISNDIIEEASRFDLVYNDVQSLKDLTFHDVEIGYGAFSTYVTYTRNVMPTFNDTLKEYLNTLMRSEIRLTLVLEKYLKELRPDLIIFHNGRFSNLKPLFCLSEILNINYITTEQITMRNGEVRCDNYYCESPHAFKARNKRIDKAWSNVGKEGPQIGKSFFLNRRNSILAGDTVVYTKDQIKGMLPEGFDPQKRNIAIFNSSEDEFFSISKEYDKSVLFPNQYEGLKTIFEHFKDDTNIHFYLRIHPNLKSVPWKSHTLLYELKYPNVTIIPPSSQISSYTLMDSVEKVIVFNSTIGLESSYWGKPVIALTHCLYSTHGLAYAPSTVEEALSLIERDDLVALGNEEDFYKFACYYMGYGTDAYKNFHITRYKLSHDIDVLPLFKICGSAVLYAYIYRIVSKLSTIIGTGRKFRHLAEKTE